MEVTRQVRSPVHTIAAAVVDSGAPRDSAMGSPRAAVTDRGMTALAISAEHSLRHMSSLGCVPFLLHKIDALVGVVITRPIR